MPNNQRNKKSVNGTPIQMATAMNGSVPCTNMRSIGYDKYAKALFLTFQNAPQKVYRFEGVPNSVVTALKTSEEKGRYFFKYIKNKYPFKLV
jgi:KTSC domain